MDTRYQPAEIEPKMYELWEKSGAFRPRSDFDDLASPYPVGVSNHPKPFSIILPPPNANDPLHVGHAMFVTIEDILIRYHRMMGDNTLWLPGTDHAGIETQYVFEKKLQKEGKSRFQFDRQTLYQMIWDYVQENSGVAVEQMKRLGASADWSRFNFTLDPKVVDLVRSTFFQLHQDGLIYRDLKLVNYCTKCGTSYSELEVLHQEQKIPLYYLKYGPFTLATTRPETKFGDTAIAVHPDDKRYQKYIGQTIEAEGLNGHFSIKVIADDFVDPEFGTGVVKITPAHDFNDFGVWQKHKDEIPGLKQVIGFDGKMMPLAGPYAGLSVEVARQKVVADLESKGLLEKIDQEYVTSVGVCYRCGRIIEPLPLPQFFLKVKDKQHNLVDQVVKALDSGETKIHGAGREQVLRNWLNQLQDWNIGRQIVWGIRIPVWYQTQGFESQITVGLIDKQGQYRSGMLSTILETMTVDEIVKGLQSISAHQDVPYEVGVNQPTKKGVWLPETDTFDTWFSSGQWPVVTLKTTQPTDFDTFYPTTVMETGYDILPIWVMRMMMLGKYLTHQSPFAHVYLHGLIRDAKGQKMSKSKGNVVNPVEVVNQIGADALRLALVIRSTPAQDKSVGEADFKAARNLTNKVWNAARYVILYFDQQSNIKIYNKISNDGSLSDDCDIQDSANVLQVADSLGTNGINQQLDFKQQSITESRADSGDKSTVDLQTNDDLVDFEQKLASVVTEVTTHLDRLRLGQAADAVVNEFRHWYCDQVIEQHKSNQVDDNQLMRGLTTFLALLHPFIPHLTESIWQELFSRHIVDHPLLITAPWATK